MTRRPAVFLIAIVTTLPSVVHASAEEDQAIAVLKSGAVPAKKEQACKTLKRIGTARSVPALAALLTDWPLGQWAIDALETMPCPQADRAIRDALPVVVPQARAAIADALGRRKNPDAVPDLIRLLNNGKPTVAVAAATALGRIGGEDAVNALKRAQGSAKPRLRVAIRDALLDWAEHLIAGGKHPEAASLYKEIAASDPLPHVRAAAFRGRVRCAGDRAVSIVVDALKGSDEVAQAVSIEFVRSFEGTDATKAFAAALSQTPAKVQVALLDALGQRKDTAALDAVLSAAKSNDASVRVAALQAIQELGSVSQLPLLAEALTTGADPEKAAARRAIKYLRRGDVAKTLIEMIKTARPEMKVALISTLPSRGATQASDMLLEMTKTEPEPVRVAAIQAMRKLADESQAEALLELILDARSDEARAAALETFVYVAARSERHDALASMALTKTSDAGVPAKCTLLRAAARLGGPGAVDALRDASKDSDPQVRGVAIEMLATHAGTDAMPDLLKIARQAPQPSHRAMAVKGYWRLLGTMKGLSPEQRLKLVRDGLAVSERPEEKRRGLAELAKIGLPAAMALAEKACTDEAVEAEAEAACLEIATRLLYTDRDTALKSLERLAKDAEVEKTRKDARAFQASLKAHAGFVVPWLVCGPYRQDGKVAKALFDIPFGPEKDGDVEWRPLPLAANPANFWQADLSPIVGGDHCVVYLKTQVYSPKAQDVVLEIGSDDGNKIWINGKLVHANNAVRGMAPAQDRAKATLKQGWNNVLVKITQHTLGCGLCMRIRAADGSRIEGLRFDPQGKAAG